MREWIVTLLCCVTGCPVFSAEPPTAAGFVLPAGFSITEFAGPELANDIYCLTIAPKGEIVVSGRGYLKQLVDENGDGRADKAILLADHPHDGAMGLLVDGDWLYLTGDGGLRRMPWRPGRFTEKSELLLKLKTGGEHAAHAISRGPDGWLYVLCGNNTGITRDYATLNSSPVMDPIAGCVLRLPPDFKGCEIIADGFRNAYGFDWNTQGELFTYDSDNERCLGLPWYEGTRFYRIHRGGFYGWRNPQLAEFWRLPPYYRGVVKPLADLGRGSPTGVACYRHQQFPPEYRDNFFLLEWTFGVIHQASVQGDQAHVKTFMKTDAGHGFAPTGIAIHPQTGDLYVSSGGRGTRGAVYRIRYEEGFRKLPQTATTTPPVQSPKSRTLHGARVESEFINDLEEMIRDPRRSPAWRLEVLADLLNRYGDIGTKVHNHFKEGYGFLFRNADAPKDRYDDTLKTIRESYPSGDKNLDRELSRAMALLQDSDPHTVTKLLRQITKQSDPIEDVHLLFVLACCPAARSPDQTAAIAQALIQLESKYTSRKLPRERNWSLRVAEAYRALVDIDPALPLAISRHVDLGSPGHLIFTEHPLFPRKEAAQRWLKIVVSDPDYPWSSALIELLGELPAAQVMPLIRQKWQEPALREALLPILAKQPVEQDRTTFIEGLKLFNAKAVATALSALEQLTIGPLDQMELLALVIAFRRWQTDAPELAKRLLSRLERLTQVKLGIKPDAWTQWLVQRFPQYRSALENQDGVDRAAWDRRLAKIPWDQSKVDAGQILFQQHCATCHQGTSPLGPDLAGIGKRFSRDDLLTAILQPSKDVSNRYRTMIVVTTTGQTHVGLEIYEAVDGIILQTGATHTMRISGDQIAGKRLSEQSLMPPGLMDKLSDREIADLVAYLRSK